jgi:hypothetical protein
LTICVAALPRNAMSNGKKSAVMPSFAQRADVVNAGNR